MGRRKGLSPTQRTLAALRDRGCQVAIVQKWNPFVGPFGIRQDLWGFGDVLYLDPAYPPGRRHAIAQACAGSGIAAHVQKIVNECTDDALGWLRNQGRIEVWGWRRVKLRRGGKAIRWAPRVVEVTLVDFAGQNSLGSSAGASVPENLPGNPYL